MNNQDIEYYKKIIMQRSAECGYALSTSNLHWMNLTRIEAIKAEIQRLKNRRDIDSIEHTVLKCWVADFERVYL